MSGGSNCPSQYIYIYIYIYLHIHIYVYIDASAALHSDRPAPERFTWSQIHHSSNEKTTQVSDVDRGMWSSLATPSEWTYKLRDYMLVTSSERRHRRYRFTCIDVIAIDKVNMACSVTSDHSSCRVYERQLCAGRSGYELLRR